MSTSSNASTRCTTSHVSPGPSAARRTRFARFWKERLGWTDADQAALDRWRRTMTEVTSAAPARSPAPLLPNTARFHPTQVARTAVIVAAIETASVDDLRRRSHGVLNTQAAAAVKGAVDHVERRIRSWFGATGRRLVEHRVGQVKNAAQRSRFADATARMAMFFDAIRTAYFQKMFPQALAQFRDERELDAFPDLNVVRFERYDALGPLGNRIPGLAGLRVHRGFAYAMPRGRGARTCLLAARDTEAIIDLIEKLAGMEALPSDGFLFSLD